MFAPVYRDSLGQDVQCFHMPCIHVTLVVDAIEHSQHCPHGIMIETNIFFAVTNTVAWLVTEKALLIRLARCTGA